VFRPEPGGGRLGAMRTWKLLASAVVVAALSVPATASAAFMHVVAPGESLSSIAAADGLSVSALAAANGLSPQSQLISGSSVAIPPQTGGSVQTGSAYTTPVSDETAAPVASVGTSSSSGGGGYLVQPGDTLSAIAARYGVSIDQLASANGLDPNGLLISGTTLSVAGAPASEQTGEDTTAATTEDVSTAPSASDATAAGGAQPTGEFVSPDTIGEIAAANGVPSSLAEAIGYQESGFNNAEVSNTGATGVMQIEPGTWSYINRNLAGPPPLSPDSATDNVRGGVLLLHSLLDQTGGDAALAAAAYYQGLPSVQQHGMYSSTQQYVNDVMSLQQHFGGP
jgi:N-acetylmuramoyl-L-alanine amidase